MEKHHDDIYENFKLYCGVSDEDVKRWVPSLRNEIIVYLRNGNRIRFDDDNKTFCYHTEYERDERGDYVLNDRDYKKAFSIKLRRLMISQRISQKELSEATGINAATLSHYMNGRNLPDLRNARRLAQALDCNIEELTELE